MHLEADERDASVRPGVPCVACGQPSRLHPILERWVLCGEHMGDWFSDPRFRGNDFARNQELTVGWLAEQGAR